jgi:hypothetical protein
MIQKLSAKEIENDYRELATKSVQLNSIMATELPVQDAYLAVNSDGDFLFIVRDPHGNMAPARRLKLLSVDYVIRLSANLGGEIINDKFTVVTLPARNSELLSGFATLLSLLLVHEYENLEQGELRKIVESLVELFTPRFGNVRDRAKGLFGELSVISASGDASSYIEGWHDSLGANKDFSLEDRYLEVKTTEGAVRKHEIGVSQLQTDNANRPIYLASVLLEEDPNGKSVIELFAEIRDSLKDAASQIKLTHQVLETLGLDYAEFDDLRFSVQGGSGGIWVYLASDLPRPTIDANSTSVQAISNIRFTLNMDVLNSGGLAHKLLTS